MRLGLSAEKENRVYRSGFDSLILALNQVLKVLLRAGLIATWTSLQIKSGLGGEAAQRLGVVWARASSYLRDLSQKVLFARKRGN